MQSNEVRVQFREALDFVRHGNAIVVKHYNRPIARIIPFEPSVKEVAMPACSACGKNPCACPS